ncbi:MAG: Crp/Fnr family transcriptional regulator [Saprospiraceae bacterium]|nr:Crp/Fnr family transcriptional regulator [Saprospiraceae bacterium]
MKEHLIPQFREQIDKLCKLSDVSWQAFSNRLNYLSLPKDAVLTHHGAVEDKVYYVGSGIVREYIVHGKKEFCIDFCFKNDFSSSYSSFITRQPSQYTMKTLTPCEFLVISYAEMTWLFENFLELNVMGRKLVEILLIEKRQRELNLLTKTAEERYFSMLAQHPQYMRHIPLKYIASFLGVTPESLSRIRAKRMGGVP